MNVVVDIIYISKEEKTLPPDNQWEGVLLLGWCLLLSYDAMVYHDHDVDIIHPLLVCLYNSIYHVLVATTRREALFGFVAAELVQFQVVQLPEELFGEDLRLD